MKKGTKVIVDTTDNQVVIKPPQSKSRFSLPFKEADLLLGLNEYTSHASELAVNSSI